MRNNPAEARQDIRRVSLSGVDGLGVRVEPRGQLGRRRD
jgi:hypothetical protein